MRLAASILLACSIILPGVLAQEKDSEVAASYESTGSCAYYFQNPTKKAPLSQTCIKYCDTHGGHGFSECDWSPYANVDFTKIDQSTIEKDEAGELWVPCRCKCEDPNVEGIATEIMNIVIEGLKEIDHVICAVMLESFKTIIEIGIDAIPGGAEATAAARAVEGAKTFFENGLTAADFFGNWVSTDPAGETPSLIASRSEKHVEYRTGTSTFSAPCSLRPTRWARA